MIAQVFLGKNQKRNGVQQCFSFLFLCDRLAFSVFVRVICSFLGLLELFSFIKVGIVVVDFLIGNFEVGMPNDLVLGYLLLDIPGACNVDWDIMRSGGYLGAPELVELVLAQVLVAPGLEAMLVQLRGNFVPTDLSAMQ